MCTELFSCCCNAAVICSVWIESQQSGHSDWRQKQQTCNLPECGERSIEKHGKKVAYTTLTREISANSRL